VVSSSAPEILNRANVKLVCFFGLAVGSRSQEVERSEPTSPASAYELETLNGVFVNISVWHSLLRY
jgi:hypothetical protein